MEKQLLKLNVLAEIADADWEKTPESVKRLVVQLEERIAALEERQQELEEQVQRNSQNSSQPPSQDAPQGLSQSQKSRARSVGEVNPVMKEISRSCMPRKSARRLKSIIRDIAGPVGKH
jgi:seryl-tRNA synthetase